MDVIFHLHGPKAKLGGSARKGKRETHKGSSFGARTITDRKNIPTNGTTHSQSLAWGLPDLGLRGVLSRRRRRMVAQRKSPASRRTIIIDRTNCQIRPTVSAHILVVAAASGSKSADNAGATTQPRIPIGTAARAQMPRILASEYCFPISAATSACALGSFSIFSSYHVSRLQAI